MKLRGPTFAIGLAAAIVLAAVVTDLALIAAKPLLQMFWWMSP